MSKRLLLIALTVLLPVWLYSQCDPSTPTFTVNLTGNPSGTWISPNIVRDGGCCGQNPRCIKFVITLDPLAAGISFTFASGAVPSGALEYQIGCALPPTPVGQPICLSGPGPHILTFCKPGNNPNTYAITSIPGFATVPDITINDGCRKVLNVSGLNPATITWNSVAPGSPGQYNSYLSCTSGCTSPTVTAAPGAPTSVKYVVCGQPAAQCNFTPVCDTVQVTFNPTLGVNILPSNPTICFGQTATTLTAVGTGGTPPYTYLWNNVNPSQTINVGVGNYQIKLSDNSGCPPVYNNVTVTAFSVAISANAGPDQTKCIQSPIATINSSVTGASGGIWSGGSGTFIPNNTTLSNVSYSPTAAEIAAGFVNLILTTTGNGSCPAKTDTVRINYQNFLGVPAPTTTNVSCFGGTNGIATMTLTGGPTPYTYLWSTAPSYTTSTINNLPIGTYSVTITDGIGCKLTTTVNITQPTPLAITSTVTNVKCFGTSTGSIDVSPTGGTPGYTYSWTPTGQTSSSAINLPVGTYSVKVLDANGCQITSNYTVTQPASITVTATQTNVSCFGGSNGAITTTVSGGTTPYSFNWSPGGSTSQSPTGLIAGNYSLTITDNFNCVATLTVAITQPTLLVASTTVVDETCDYLNNGSITTSVTGGTPTYTYSWSSGQTTSSISALPSGTYTVIVTDSKGCISTVVSTVNQPPPLAISITSGSVSCFGGSNGTASGNATGGTPAYTYSWSPGGSTSSSISGLPIGTYTVALSDSKNCLATNTVLIIQPTDIVVTGTVTNVFCSGGSNGTISTTVTGGVSPYTYFWSSGQTTSSVSGLIAGTYTLIVTDNNGCQKTLTYTVTQPAPLAIAFTSTNVSCFNGSDAVISSTVTGGTPGYTYTWSPGGQTTSNVSGLPIGTYTLSVNDALGCIVVNSITITQPTSLTPVATVVDETCDYLNNGSITTSVTGGTPGYTYLWTPGGQTTTSVSALSSGTYSVAVTDSKGCVSIVAATVNQPPTLVASFNAPVNVSCFGGSNGSVDAIGTGGTPNYTYSWSPGGSTSSNISGLPIGTYTVAITDAQNCLATNTVLITQPTDIVVTGTVINVSCNGGSNGTIATTVTGGVSPYTYFWSAAGQTTSSVSGLIAGTYTLIVTDNNGCQKTLTYTVTEPTPLAIAFTSTNVSCFNGSNAIINSLVSGGTPGYTYSWSPGGQTTQNISGLPIGTYTLQAFDSFSCPAISTITITQPTSLTLVPSSTNETCDYLNNGTGTVTVSGGTTPYTYLWQNGSSTSTTSGLASGTYTVRVTDNLSCVAFASVTITEPTPLVVTFTNQVNVSCFGGNDASIGAILSGGTPNYTYSWSPGGATTNALFNIPAGTYSVTITDNNSCMVVNSVVITQPALPVSVSATSTSITCNGGSNGSVTSTGAGGTGPYTYELIPGSLTGQTVGSLIAGTYTTTVTDNNGCMASNTVNVIQPTPIVPVTTATSSTCGGSNGKGSVTASGGIGPYTYQWTSPVSTATLITGLFAGAYSVTVTDANGCQEIGLLLVNDIGGPTASVLSTTNVSCFGGSDGAAIATASAIVGPLSYTWNPVGGNGLTATGLPAGTYYIEVKDGNGCIALALAPVITEPTIITSDIVTSDVSCFGGANGTATVSALGGTPGYTYTWLPAATTGSVITGLTAGTFSVQVRDTKNCIHTNTFSIAQPTAAVAIAVSSTSVSCFGGSNGSASSVVTGGTSPYLYTWNPGNISGQNISNLPQGTYSITATDIQGCTTNNIVTVIQPTAITLSMASANSNCSAANGQATVTASGGMGSYTYTWTAYGGNNNVATGLIASTYSVLVNDINGCPKTATVTVGDNPGPVVNVASTTSVSCFGGSNASATATVSGGTAPFTYTWTNSGGAVVGSTATATGLPIGLYTVSITAANGCLASAVTPSAIIQPMPLALNVITSNVSCFAGANGSASVTAFGGIPGYTFTWLPSLSTGSVVTGQAANTYSVRVNDFNNCTHTIPYTITQPTAALAVSAVTSSVSCFGGSNGTASANASGGTASYTYTWNPGNFASQNISNLAQGTYTVRTRDSKGCIATRTVAVIQPTQIALNMASANSNCSAANGQATVTASGGMGSYTYTWTAYGGNNNVATGLIASTYSVLVKDINGCPKTATVTVGDNPGPVVNVSSTTSVSCFGGSNASATASVTGGTGPFTYTWTNSGGAVVGSTATATGLSIGLYTVSITAANGCLASAVTPSAIIQPMPLALNVITSNVSCFAGANGSASVTAFGGIPGYTFTWLPGLSTGSVVTGQAANTYSVRVNDFNNCTHTVAYSITQPIAALASTTSFTSVSCFAGNNGIASAQASGGTGPYTYNWQPVNTNGQVATGLSTGTYTVNITDSKGCTATNTVLVTQPTLSLTATSNGSPSFCFGGSTGSATVTPNGGTPGYTYTWTPIGGNNPTASGLAAGNYNVLVNDVKGCQTNVNVIISQPTAVTGTLSPYNPACAMATGSISSQATGGTGPYTYAWSPGSATTQNITGLLPGTYTLVISDFHGCQKTLSTTLINLPGPSVSLVSTTSVSCFGGNDGSATVSVTSGNPPYNVSWLPSGSTSTTATSLAAGIHTANILDSRGCPASITANIIEPTPVAISVSSITSVSCFGGNNGAITVSGSGGAPGYIYTWLPSGFGGPTLSNLSAGTYTVRAIDTHSCPAMISVVVTQPTTLVSSNGGVNNPACFNSVGNATVNASGGTPPYTFTWTSTPAQNGNVATNLPAGSYTAFVNDANGCAASTNFNLTQPTQVVTNAGVNDTICLGQTGVITCTGSGGSGNYYYTWQPTAVTNSGTYSVSPTSNTTYTVMAFDQIGCAGNPDTVSVIVYNLTAADIDAIAYSPLCPGQITTVYATVAGVQGPLTFNWSVPSFGNGPGAYTITPTQPTTYSVTVTNACGGTVTDSVRVEFNPPPVVSLGSDAGLVCIPTTINFTDNSITGNVNDPITSWLWNFGNGQTSTAQNPTFTYTATGTYSITLTVTTANGCTNNNASGPMVVNAYPYPVAAFTLNPAPPTVINLPYDVLHCTNQSVGAVSYVWTFGEGGSSQLANPNYQYTTVGVYPVQLVATNQYGCSDTAIAIVTTDADIVFPNAFTPNGGGPNGGFYVPGALDNDVFFPVYSGIIDYKLQIFNRWGELIFETFDIRQGWDGYYRDKICQVGVYVWKAYAKFNNGKTFNKTGDVTLLK